MILSLDDLVKRLDASRRGPELGDTKATDALWIKFAAGQIQRKEEFSTPDKNQLLQVHLDADGQLLGLEIFP